LDIIKKWIVNNSWHACPFKSIVIIIYSPIYFLLNSSDFRISFCWTSWLILASLRSIWRSLAWTYCLVNYLLTWWWRSTSNCFIYYLLLRLLLVYNLLSRCLWIISILSLLLRWSININYFLLNWLISINNLLLRWSISVYNLLLLWCISINNSFLNWSISVNNLFLYWSISVNNLFLYWSISVYYLFLHWDIILINSLTCLRSLSILVIRRSRINTFIFWNFTILKFFFTSIVNYSLLNFLILFYFFLFSFLFLLFRTWSICIISFYI